MEYQNKQLGFTLIELILVLAVLGIIIAIVSLPLSNFRKRQSLQNSTNAIVSVLNEARTKTLAAVSNTSYSVRLQSDKVILFTGTTYTAGLNTNEETPLDSPTTASWSLHGGGSDISFERLKGSTSQYGTITISLPDGTGKIITVTSLGSIVRN